MHYRGDGASRDGVNRGVEIHDETWLEGLEDRCCSGRKIESLGSDGD